MSSAIDVLNAARGELGFVEGPNNDSKYGEWYGLNHNPYCAMFVSWCFNEAGMSSLVAASSKKGFASCASGLAWFQKNKQVVNKYAGQPGDIVFYNFSGNGVADHVGIIEGASKDGITTLEANTSPDHSNGSQANGGGVYRRHRPYLNVMAIVRPKYLVATKPTSSLAQNKKLAGGVAAATAVGGGGAATLNNHSAVPVKPTTVISAPPFPGSVGFKIGSKNAAVKAVEDALFKAGLLPKTLDDGLFTKETTSAVKKYQAANLTLGKPDGIIGIKTYGSLTKGK
jgi:hypothetical protein